MPRLRHGMARVEFLTVRGEVEVMIAQGYAYALIYEKLKSQGKISMCYGAFRTYIHGGQAKSRGNLRRASEKPEQTPARDLTPTIPIGPPALPESASTAQTSAPVCSGLIRIKSSTSKFDSKENNFGIDELGPTWE